MNDSVVTLNLGELKFASESSCHMCDKTCVDENELEWHIRIQHSFQVSDDISEVRRLRTSHIHEWLTDNRVNEAMEDVQTVIRQEARDRKSDAMRVIGDTINKAQQGMDLAFAAGTLSTTAGVSAKIR